MTGRCCYAHRPLVAFIKIPHMLILIKCFPLHNSQPGRLCTNSNNTVIIPNKYWIPPCKLPSDSAIHSLNFQSGNFLHVGGEFLKPSQVNKSDESRWLRRASNTSSSWNTKCDFKTIQLEFYIISIKSSCFCFSKFPVLKPYPLMCLYVEIGPSWKQLKLNEVIMVRPWSEGIGALLRRDTRELSGFSLCIATKSQCESTVTRWQEAGFHQGLNWLASWS